MSNVPSQTEYAYDVAYSFLSEDEDLVQKIDDLLKDRLRTFIYTNRQEQIAGTDGELTLNRVFGSEARTVVVFYRTRWGTTPFTRVEETAIRNRAHEEGYDFCIFVPLEEQADVPRWLPKPRIWPNLGRWGADGLAAVIEARVGELGGRVQEETGSIQAARLNKELEIERERQSFLGSYQGVEAAKAEFTALTSELNGVTSKLRETSPQLELSFDSDRDTAAIRGSGASLVLTWVGMYANTLRESYLSLELYDGYVPSNRFRWAGRQAEVVKEMQLDFYRDQSGVHGWRGPTRFFSSAQFADECLKLWVDQMRKSHLR
ncbi:MAG TPA: hypothetical protein VFR81_01340 [Longimicrobium sp.]|nr:hypothetical protein [Longimicrobium sp.]